MIRFLLATEEPPWELLLDADPERELVAGYLASSQVLVAEEQQEVAGVVVFQQRETEWEIMNVAVAPEKQHKGIGRQLLTASFVAMKERAPAKPVLIKTGDLTSPALSLYQRLGFRPIAVVKDYFITHYPEPIYEDGQLLRNQVILKRYL